MRLSISDLVSDLLDLGKIEAGLDAAREPMDLIPVIGEALRLVKPRAEAKTIVLHAELAEEAIISAVPSRVRQVLINIIDNGVKYTPAGGRVMIASAVSDGHDARTVTIRVTDTGIGTHAPTSQFLNFYRVKSGATKNYRHFESVSLLPGIVEAYGGQIRQKASRGAGLRCVGLRLVALTSAEIVAAKAAQMLLVKQSNAKRLRQRQNPW
jgi:K+-sensing histidine kinase KdpD